jgi:hypothetical protein
VTRGGSPLLLLGGQLAALQSVARACSVDLVPLKGMELAFGYYASPSERPMYDVDVFVPNGFSAAVERLLRAGFVERGHGVTARVFVPPSSSIEVDVHRRLLPPAMGALSAAAVVREGRIDRTTFGVPVTRMCAEHLLLHLCGNRTKDCFHERSRDVFARDVSVVVPHVDPSRFQALAREARLSGTAFMALSELAAASALREALAIHPLRARQLLWMRDAILRSRRWPELAYALARASCDGVALPFATIALSLVRAARDRVRGTPRWMD